MNEPKENWDQVKEAIKEMVSRCPREFEAFIGWIESERDERDIENRVPGQENTTSEVQALTTILTTVRKASGTRTSE